jgi:hypothetical protein
LHLIEWTYGYKTANAGTGYPELIYRVPLHDVSVGVGVPSM